MTTPTALRDQGCRIEGCLKRKSKRGMCAMHHWRWKHKGDPLAPVAQPIPDVHGAALRYVDRCHWVGDCLILRADGNYGEVSWGPASARSRTTAHRAVHLTFNGPLGESEVARHRCDNPPCVNPSHIEAGSVADNARDMYERSRRDGVQSGARGVANGSAVMNDDLVAQLRREVRSGISIRQAARNHGIEYSSAYRAVTGKTWSHVSEPVIERKRQGHPNPRRTPDEVGIKAARMAAEGMSLAEIGAELGIDRVTAHRAIHRVGFRRERVA